MTESYKTKEGKTITRQNGFDASKAATFLETVYEPAFTAEP